MPQLLELSFQTILLTWRKVLLGSYPHEAECVIAAVLGIVACMESTMSRGVGRNLKGWVSASKMRINAHAQ